MHTPLPSVTLQIGYDGAAPHVASENRFAKAVRERLPFAGVLAAMWTASWLPTQWLEGHEGFALVMTALMEATPMMALVVVLSALVDVYVHHAKARVTFLAMAAIIAAVLGESIGLFVLLALGAWTPELPARVVWLSNFGFELSMCVIAVYACDCRSRAKRRTAALRTLRRSRALAEKRTVEARLRAMQARVDPQWLLNTLAAVESLQEAAPAVGRRLLDDLIAYLRSALADGHAETSTIGKELALAGLWLDIWRVVHSAQLEWRVEVRGDVETMSFPPLIITPLLEAAVCCLPGPACIKASVDDEPEKLTVTIAIDAQLISPQKEIPASITTLRSRLREVYGEHADVLFRRDRITIEIRHGELESTYR
jgi:hypothetical protein